jgi:hypothetical protein
MAGSGEPVTEQTSGPIDFEDLLRRYILHVTHHESVDYLSDHDRHPALYSSMPDPAFTDEEWSLLRRLSGRD